MDQPWELSVEDVFQIAGRGVAVTGVLTGGAVKTGDAARTPNGGLVEAVVVEFHSRPGKVALLLRGDQLPPVVQGDVLRRA